MAELPAPSVAATLSARDPSTGDCTAQWTAVAGVPGYTANLSEDGKPDSDPTKVWRSGPSVLGSEKVTITGTDPTKPLDVRVRSLSGSAPGPTAHAPAVAKAATVDIALTANKGGVVVNTLPSNTKGDVAWCEDVEGKNAVFPPASKGLAVGGVAKPPDAKHTFADAVAVDAAGKQSGDWYSESHTPHRLQAVFAGATGATGASGAPTGPSGATGATGSPSGPGPSGATGATGPTTINVLLGLHGGNWGSQAPIDIGNTGVKTIRLPGGKLAAEAAGYTAAGFEIVGIFAETGSLSSFANEATAFAKRTVEAGLKYNLLALEVFNEPDGNWFWSDPGNIPAIKTVLKAVREAATVMGYKGSIITSFDGGKGGSEGVAFGEKCQREGVFQFVSGVTVHPYGGASGGNGGALGDRHKIEVAERVTGLGVWITELGWPTGSGSTGDSQAWTESQQAANYTGFILWVETRPKVRVVTFYGYKNTSDSGADQYGVEKHDSSYHKPAFKVLGDAATAIRAKVQVSVPLREHIQHMGLEVPTGEIKPGTEEHTWGPGEKLTPEQLADLAHASMG